METNLTRTVQNWSTTTVAPSKRGLFFIVPSEIGIPFSIMDGAAVLVGGTANFLVMAMIGKHHRTLQNMDLFIFNLCLSDFLSSICFQPNVILRLLADSRTPRIQTTLRRIAAYIFLSAGCSNLFLVTLDRYLNTSQPFHYFRYVTKRKVYLSIGCVWIISLVIGLWPLISRKISSVIYLAYTSTVFALTITLQILAFLIAKRQEKSIRQLQQSVFHNHHLQGRKTSSDQRRRSQAQTKATKTIIVLFLVYVGSWLPVTLFRAYFNENYAQQKVFGIWINVFNAVLQLHACINPFIYVLRTRRVREKFHRLKRKVSPMVTLVASPTCEGTATEN